MNVPFFYTLSDAHGLPPLLDDSLKSIDKYVNKEDIYILYTPPLSNAHIKTLRSQDYTVQIKHVTPPWRFSCKNLLCDHETENLVFLDCDLLFYKDITELWKQMEKEDYLFAGRPDTAYTHHLFQHNLWEETCKQLNVRVLPEINTGFMMFREDTHKKIKRDWNNYLEAYLSRKLSSPIGRRTINQLALTLAISKNVPLERIWLLDDRHHIFEWSEKGKGRDTYVFHRKTP